MICGLVTAGAGSATNSAGKQPDQSVAAKVGSELVLEYHEVLLLSLQGSIYYKKM